VVYITKSNPSMAVIYVQAFVVVILFGKLMRKIWFGTLRAAEFEHLVDRSWYAVTETCLAFTVFKDDFSPKFVALFTLLLFLKSFHWLSEDRVDFMERSPSISALFHIRVISLAVLLGFLDVNFIIHAYQSTLTKGASVQLVFGFEYAVLLTLVANILIKYLLHSIDLYSENPWENKAVFMLYTELVIGLLKVILYALFIVIMVRIYTLPLFAVRPMYLTARAFKKALRDVVLSRRAIHNMNTWYPDATEEELANSDNVCIICREEMQAPSTKKLPCGHIFHKNCLRSWFQRQQTCPTCRLDVLRAPTPGQQRQQRNQRPQQAQQAQQPQQQQQQQPQQPQNIPNMNQVFAQLMAANARLQFPVPAPIPAAPASTSTGATTSTTSTSSTTANTSTAAGGGAATAMPTMFPPPPPFFMPPFSIPPPMPPQDFSGLTEDELKAMEGHERANVEARIKCLRNIQVLLDAAVMEMQQYSSVVGQLDMTSRMSRPAGTTSSTSSSVTSTTSVVSSTTTATISASVSNDNNVKKPALPTAETGARPKVKLDEKKDPNPTEKTSTIEDQASGGNGNGASVTNKSEEVVKNDVETTASNADQTNDDDQNEIRKRRLEKFGNANQNSTTD